MGPFIQQGCCPGSRRQCGHCQLLTCGSPTGLVGNSCNRPPLTQQPQAYNRHGRSLGSRVKIFTSVSAQLTRAHAIQAAEYFEELSCIQDTSGVTSDMLGWRLLPDRYTCSSCLQRGRYILARIREGYSGNGHKASREGSEIWKS